MNVGAPAGSPVTVDTTVTPPDCSAPLTVIFFPFIATLITGSAPPRAAARAGGAERAASAAPPGMAGDRPAATAAAPAVMEVMRLIAPPG